MAKRLVKEAKPSGIRRTARMLYGVLVAIAAIIVVLYGSYKLFVRAPAQAAPPTASLPEHFPSTDNPDTPGDESEAQPTSAPLARQENVYTFLVAASDFGGGNADSIMVAKYDIPNRTVGVVSIMRDTMTEEYAKINTAYSHGPEALRDTVSDLLGIPIDYYITVNMKGFKALVNAVGGIDFYVPSNMNYDDTTPGQELRIHYQKGMQHLDGQQALEVARFRHNNDGSGYTDTGRTQTQRDMLTAVVKKVLSPSAFLKINTYIDLFNTYVKTDLTVENMLYFATNAKDVDLNNAVTSAVLPGETFGDRAHRYKGYSWCWQLEPVESLQLVNDLVNPYTSSITSDMVNFVQAW